MHCLQDAARKALQDAFQVGALLGICKGDAAPKLLLSMAQLLQPLVQACSAPPLILQGKKDPFKAAEERERKRRGSGGGGDGGGEQHRVLLSTFDLGPCTVALKLHLAGLSRYTCFFGSCRWRRRRRRWRRWL